MERKNLVLIYPQFDSGGRCKLRNPVQSLEVSPEATLLDVEVNFSGMIRSNNLFGNFFVYSTENIIQEMRKKKGPGFPSKNN